MLPSVKNKQTLSILKKLKRPAPKRQAVTIELGFEGENAGLDTETSPGVVQAESAIPALQKKKRKLDPEEDEAAY